MQGGKQAAQLKRLIRYTKAWADQQGKNMPKGVALTTLTTNGFVSHSRDDLSLLYTLRSVSVSYTPLDVYKRQVNKQPSRLALDFDPKGEAGVFENGA